MTPFAGRSRTLMVQKYVVAPEKRELSILAQQMPEQFAA